MSTKADRTTILDALEDDYRHDLAIHLYSSYLLHSLNPLFPKKNWASWPLPPLEVPDPQTTTNYVDSNSFVNEFPIDINGEKLTFTPMSDSSLTSTQQSSLAIQELSSSEDEDEDQMSVLSEEEEEEEDFYNEKKIRSRQVMKIKTVSFQETLSNSKADLMNELMALVERKIHKRIKEQNRGNIVLSESSRKLFMHMSQILASRVNTTLDKILAIQKTSAPRKSEKRPFMRLLNWQDILIACSSEPNKKDRISNSYRTVYDKCEYLFGGSKYNYDYDDESENDDDNDDENNGDSTNEVISSETINRIGDERRSFNEEDYLDEVESLNVSNAIYRNFNKNLKKRKLEIEKLSEMEKKLFDRKLEADFKTNQLTWNPTAGKKSSQRKRFPIKTLNKDLARELALSHGGISLNEDEYIIN